MNNSFKRKKFRIKTNKNLKANNRIYYKLEYFNLSLTPLSESESESESNGSLCFCISKKKIPLSVDRHQLKRYLFEYFRLNKSWVNKYHVWIRFSSKKKYDKTNFSFNKISKQISDSCPEIFKIKN